MKLNLTREELYKLYPNDGNYKDLKYKFEHRVDDTSLSIIYGIMRVEKPKNILQIGSWLGGTTCVMAAALKNNKTEYKFTVSELLENLQRATLKNVEDEYGVSPMMIGDITKELPDNLNEIDFLYHDTDHDRETTEWVVNNVFSRLKEGAIVIFHDWAVIDKEGKWIAKDGAWPETRYLIELKEQNRLPLQKVYFAFEGNGSPELGIFVYHKP